LLRLSACLLPLLSLTIPTQGRAVETSTAKVLGRAPLAFEPNLGQSDPQVRYLARGAGYALFLTRDEAVLALMSASPGPSKGQGALIRQSVLRMRPLGSRPAEALEPEQSLPGRSNYVRPSEPGKALRDVPRYGRVRAKGIYPGIDLVYYGSGERLEYDFVVAPGADPDRIRLGFEGAEGLALDEAGNLRLRLSTGEVVQPAPVLYQEAGGQRRPVSGRFVLANDTEGFAVGFEVRAYDPALPLVIDPTLAWASLLGGSSTEWTFDVAVTPNGQAYACGYTYSTNFPTRPSATDPDLVNADAYVTKFNLDGSGIDWSTYVGGPGYQRANAIALDYNRNSYVTGSTDERDPNGDAWVFLVDAAGNLQWSRILGGTGDDAGNEIFVDSSLNAYVVGTTFSSDFRGPNANPNVAQPSFGGGSEDAFVAKLNRFGTVVYTTYYGDTREETGAAIALDLSGRMVFTGTVTTYDPVTYNASIDAYAVRLSADGSAFQGRYTFGGGGDDYAGGIAVDPSGNVWVAGTTYSGNFLTTPDAIRRTLSGKSDAFLARLFNSWAGFSYSTYIGDAQKQVVIGLLADDAGRLYPVGQVTQPPDPTQPDVEIYDLWAARYTPSTNTASTITFPAPGNDYTGGCAMDSSRWIYIAGVTTDDDLATPGAFQTSLKGSFDGFVAKVGF
jgi:hypothetical protein